MKGMFKRALGVVAAAAMAMTGAVALAGTANAAENDTIVITGDVANRTFDIYKLGTYSRATTDTVGEGEHQQTCINSVNLTQNPAWAKPTITQAVEAAIDVIPSSYAGNELTYFANNANAKQLTTFTTELMKNNPLPAPAALQVKTGANDTQVEFSGLVEGWYLVTDSDGTPLLVSTKITANSMIYGCMVSGATLGTAAAKPKTVSSGKTADKDSVKVGDTVTYTLTGKVPNTINQTEYTYKFIDTPGIGLTVKPASVQVYIAGTPLENPEAGDPYYTVTPNETFDGNSNMPSHPAENDNQLVVDLSDWVTTSAAQAQIGADITVSYEATVNAGILSDDELSGQVSNNMVVNSNNTMSGGSEETVYTYGFRFTKVDADNNPLNGATFTVQQYDTETQKAGAYLSGTGTAQDPYTFGDTADSYAGENGVFTFDGLPAGTYYVAETTVPDGYIDSIKATFTVTIGDGSPQFKEIGVLGLVDGQGTVTGQNGATPTVLNVTSVTQLPMTGAAGTMLFTVLGLLIAGAGALVYMKSRNVKRALRG
ncbi:putative LPXTG-motif protein cell wall anchor domain protein [Bifidobacterium pullorum]|uniref:Putative LPXTG-motif protein cell wall anchor domain protein n=1 Tax=Bifidobacterium pullorum TaxID=78448 RepID=A0A7V8HQ14_9BIFI|nr:putative LPXTG-motif protein cell wall anchor domain protein [Bifidobacterium pullorum]